MTFLEAMEALYNYDERVRQKNWARGVYVRFNNGVIIDQDGEPSTIQLGDLGDNWEIFKEYSLEAGIV